MLKLLNFFKRLFRNRKGQTALEYALILAVVSFGIYVVFADQLRPAVEDVIVDLTTKVRDQIKK